LVSGFRKNNPLKKPYAPVPVLYVPYVLICPPCPPRAKEKEDMEDSEYMED
jgi:hypothetical protein